MGELIDNISSIISKLYLSIEDKGYDILIKISDITQDMFLNSPLNIIYNDKYREYVELLVWAISFGFIVFYLIKLLLYVYCEINIENMYYFIIKSILIIILSINSYYVCEKVIYFNELFTNIVSQIFEDISGTKISYDYIKDERNTLQEIFDFDDKINIEGILDAAIAMFVVNMIIFHSIRYVLIILNVIISPIAFLMLLSPQTSYLFAIWVKMLLYSLLIQIFNKFILFIIIISKDNKDVFCIVLLGALFIMYKANKEIGAFLYAKNK